MSCESLRERITAEPERDDPEFDRHAEECPPCSAYRSRLLKAEGLIRQALEFDVAAVQATRDRDAAPAQAARGVPWTALGAGLAAGVIAAAGIWFWAAGGPSLTSEQLARAVTAHWYDEPESWVTSDRRVASTDLERVLAGAASIDSGRLQAISYAKICWVAGERTSHLVVQGDAGPIMVLLLPARSLSRPVPLELRDEGLTGRIVPAGAGSIAVLGADEGDTERIEQLVSSAVEWSI